MKRRWLALAAVVARATLLTILDAGQPGAARAAGSGAVPARQGGSQFCWHDYLSGWHCPDSLPNTELDAAAIASAPIAVTMRNGQTKTSHIQGPVDALFLNVRSTENFLLRYYPATDSVKARTFRTYLHPAAKTPAKK